MIPSILAALSKLAALWEECGGERERDGSLGYWAGVATHCRKKGQAELKRPKYLFEWFGLNQEICKTTNTG